LPGLAVPNFALMVNIEQLLSPVEEKAKASAGYRHISREQAGRSTISDCDE
jgi:hypothetical protein